MIPLRIVVLGVALLVSPAICEELWPSPYALQRHLENVLSINRNLLVPKAMSQAQEYVLNFFNNLTTPDNNGMLSVDRQAFQFRSSEPTPYTLYNIVYLVKGTRWGTSEDSLSVIGAHLDTTASTPGVNDNGSGMAALLEAARLVTSSSCERMNSVIFVTFDAEEIGLDGSRTFVNEYLVPEVLDRFNISDDVFQGALILDTILNFNSTPHSQTMPQGINMLFPKAYARLVQQQFRGDFLLVAGRSRDSNLTSRFTRYWSKVRDTSADNTSLQNGGRHADCVPLTIPSLRFPGLGDFLRSDHQQFWFHKSERHPQGLKALFLTDTANFRGYMQECYHSPCDDLQHIDDDMLDFLALTTHVVAASVLHTATERSNCLRRTVEVSDAGHFSAQVQWTVPVALILTAATVIGANV